VIKVSDGGDVFAGDGFWEGRVERWKV
jgi:hypothetical protein